jgi:protein PhnA
VSKELQALLPALNDRSSCACELCSAKEDLEVYAFSYLGHVGADYAALLCPLCEAQLQLAAQAQELDVNHLNCLRESAWSQVPVVQVLAYRLLTGLSAETWASELLEQIYLEDETLAWAKSGLPAGAAGTAEQPKDANGQILVDGDSVVIQKELDVKGAGFAAKRGTLVKNIKVGEDPTHVEGKVNGVSIFLKTCFLKKA